MSEYDDARLRVVLELMTEGQHAALFSASLAEANGDDAAARGIYFRRRLEEVLRERADS